MDNTIAREYSKPRFFVEAQERLDRMYTEIIRLGLERHVVELELYGYTVVEDCAPLNFFDELRDTIIRLGAADAAAGKSWPLAGPQGSSYLVPWLLARGRIFE